MMFVRASRDCTNKMYFFIKSIYFVALLFNWSTDPMNSSSLRKQPFSTWNYTERCICSKVVVSFSFPLTRSEALSQSLFMTLRPTHCVDTATPSSSLWRHYRKWPLYFEKQKWAWVSFPWPLLCPEFWCHGMIRDWIRRECAFLIPGMSTLWK